MVCPQCTPPPLQWQLGSAPAPPCPLTGLAAWLMDGRMQNMIKVKVYILSFLTHKESALAKTHLTSWYSWCQTIDDHIDLNANQKCIPHNVLVLLLEVITIIAWCSTICKNHIHTCTVPVAAYGNRVSIVKYVYLRERHSERGLKDICL